VANGPAEHPGLRESSPLRTPRAAAVAGIVFSVLLIACLVLLKLSVPSNEGSLGSWLSDSRRRTAVAVALYLVPFAGIAFLWFIGVVRDRIGDREDRFFATVFLGSGLLFVAMLFVAAAFAGGLLAEATARASDTPGPDTLALARRVTSLLLNLYAMRMAAVFTIVSVTISLRTGLVPRWLGFLGYAAAVVLLFGVGFTAWFEVLFPLWILALSVEILRTGLRVRSSGPQADAGT
jgi:hypothetical protein